MISTLTWRIDRDQKFHMSANTWSSRLFMEIRSTRSFMLCFDETCIDTLVLIISYVRIDTESAVMIIFCPLSIVHSKVHQSRSSVLQYSLMAYRTYRRFRYHWVNSSQKCHCSNNRFTITEKANINLLLQ